MVRHDSLPVELDVVSPAPPSPALSLSRSQSGNPFDTPSSALAKSPASSVHQRDPSPGPSAWAFVVAAFILETVIWGFSFSFATILVYLQRTEPWSDNSIGILSAIGAVNLGVQYLLPCVFPLLLLHGLVRRRRARARRAASAQDLLARARLLLKSSFSR